MGIRPAARRAAGFTLIELLVVVAIIALLVSILTPALKGARDQAKQVVCLSHLKNQSAAASQYAGDQDDLMLSGIINDGPIEYLGDPRVLAGGNEVGLAQQYWLPYLGYQIPLEKVIGPRDLVWREWDRLFGDLPTNGERANDIYRSSQEWQGRMGDAFQTIESYQCPSFPAIAFRDAGNVTTLEMDFVTNAMPSPFSRPNIGRPADLEVGREDQASGVGIGTVHYWDRRRKSNVRAASELIHIGEADESVALRDVIDRGLSGGRTPPRQSFLPYAIFVGGHLPYAKSPRIDNDLDSGEVKKRHPGGATLAFFDGHAEAMSYRKIDPGSEKPLSIRLRYLSDPTKLPPEYQ
jgi:prepilin-type N-terminal cleavage/methylation domain-containing protein/prepilin-type processing-associated H-X9-DG protein